MDLWMHGYDKWINEWIDGCMNRTNGQMNGLMDA